METRLLRWRIKSLKRYVVKKSSTGFTTHGAPKGHPSSKRIRVTTCRTLAVWNPTPWKTTSRSIAAAWTNHLVDFASNVFFQDSVDCIVIRVLAIAAAVGPYARVTVVLSVFPTAENFVCADVATSLKQKICALGKSYIASYPFWNRNDED